jgi:transcription elongation factor Elf1
LAYSGIVTDDATLETFIYEELQKRLGGKTAHVRKSPFAPRSVYATKKVVRKVTPKTSSKLVRHCSACGKAGHTKVNCPRLKRTKKVNHVYQDEVEEPEDPEEEYIEEYIEEEGSEEEEENDDEVEYVDDDESPSDRNCYAVKKKWCEVEYL